jgi:hypothetical protein
LSEWEQNSWGLPERWRCDAICHETSKMALKLAAVKKNLVKTSGILGIRKA